MANTKDTDNKGRRLTLAPTGLAQYLSLDSCDRFLRFYLYKGETAALARRLEKSGLRLALQPFGPLMAELGDRIEAKVLAGLKAQGYRVHDLTDQDVKATLQAIKRADAQPTYLYQAALSGPLGKWQFEGRADLIRVKRREDGRISVLVGDVKSTRKDKVNHRLQVAVYVRIVQHLLKEAGIATGDFSGTVVRRNPDGSLSDPETTPVFELEPYYSALEQLAEAEDSALARVDTANFEDLHYYLDQKCDGCLFNPICMVESAERQDVALIPFLESADKRVLAQYGIHKVGELAGLKLLPVQPEKGEDSPPPERKLTTTPGKEAVVKALSETWPIAPRLDRLIQRATRVMRRLSLKDTTRSYSYFFDAGRSSLPDDKKYPELVKLFLDVQKDYLEDRLYLAGAQVVGPKGVVSVIKMTAQAPDAAAERELLVGWVTGIFEAVFRVAEDPTAAPLHLYMYNRHDQKAVLEALRRHLDVFASIPALYDLLTGTPALTQSAVSFVYDEVKERLNLSSTGHTLQAVASQVGFKWDDGEAALYYRLFEPGMFDYLWRREDGLRIESAARFYSTIPLEYAYGAWGMLREEDFKQQQRGKIKQYLQVTPENIRNFQAKRLEALAHIEAGFRFKNGFITKEALNLVALGSSIPAAPPFRRVLEEFLYIEHYANLQEHLELFNQPIVKRVQQGRALLVRCTAIHDIEDKGRPAILGQFVIDFSETGLNAEAALQLSKVKAGDFVVLNVLEKDGKPWDTVRGRICVVNSLDEEVLILKPLDITTKGGKGEAPPFRYTHDTKLVPEPGDYYTIDEMVDDLNGDKLLLACKNAEANPFYHLLAQSHEAERNQRQNLPAELGEKAIEFAAVVAELEGKNTPTVRQLQVIAGNLEEKLFLVQGPPGTGKSHTIGWATLARMYAERAAGGGSLRVAVSCQTHNAVKIVLQSIASKLERLKKAGKAGELADTRIFKVGGDDDIEPVAGVEQLKPWEQRFQLGQILGSTLVVIGGTPGGLYNLMKQKVTNRGNDTLWQAKPFDLVILDEASQMNIPQALLASAWLRQDGQLIVVGDHRQMSPILAHSWDDEDRLSAVSSQPYRSVFQFLVDQGFPRVALDESFRLHKVQAEFLNENIYQQDGILFHSRRQQVLPLLDIRDMSPYMQAVLDPDYPVVVIVHNERASQQANHTEAELITPIVEYCVDVLDLDGDDGIGVVVPHRAQKALLRSHFPLLAASNAIDTVERFQGGEREVIIVSATASDPDYVRAEAEFLLNPNRLNVALSRPRKKLIVVASTAVFNFLSSDLEVFNQSVLWKRLLGQCMAHPLWLGTYAGAAVRVYGKPA